MLKAKEKSKHGTLHRLDTLLFVGLWVLPQMAGWVAAGVIWELFRNVFISSEFLNALLVGVLPGVVAALGQRWIIARDTGSVMRGWLRTSTLGWLVSSFVFYQFFLTSNNTSGALAPVFVSMFLPAALAQAWWLHKRVHNAWLWVMATVASAFVFALPAQITSSSTIVMLLGLGLAGLLQGSIMGMTMRYLWSAPRAKDKRNHAELNAENDLETYERWAYPAENSHANDLPYPAEEHLAAAVQRQVGS